MQKTALIKKINELLQASDTITLRAIYNVLQSMQGSEANGKNKASNNTIYK